MAAYARKHQVEQDQRRQGFTYLSPSTIAVGGDGRRKTGLAQCTFQQVCVERFILNDLNNRVCHHITIQKVLFRDAHGRVNRSLTRRAVPLISLLTLKLTRR